jgi:hypothetical protein
MLTRGMFRWKCNECLMFKNKPANVTTAPESGKRLGIFQWTSTSHDTPINIMQNQNRSPAIKKVKNQTAKKQPDRFSLHVSAPEQQIALTQRV